jgi:hypothetical protein
MNFFNVVGTVLFLLASLSLINFIGACYLVEIKKVDSQLSVLNCSIISSLLNKIKYVNIKERVASVLKYLDNEQKTRRLQAFFLSIISGSTVSMSILTGVIILNSKTNHGENYGDWCMLFFAVLLVAVNLANWRLIIAISQRLQTKKLVQKILMHL